jgi:hypothetical protein
VTRTALISAALALTLAVTGQADAAPKTGPGCLLPNADTTLHGIMLGDRTSTERVLGRDRRGAPDNPDTDFPWYAFASRDGRQTMRLRRHAGDVVDSYMEFEVRRGRDAKALSLPTRSFVTGKGVKLGMTRKAVFALFGPCFTAVRQGKTEILRYEIEDASDKPQSPPLQSANMPQYYAEYEFENGRLIRFAFGHDPV